MMPGSSSKSDARTRKAEEREIDARKPYWDALNHGSRFFEDGLNIYESAHDEDRHHDDTARRPNYPSTGAGIREHEHTAKHTSQAPKHSSPTPQHTSEVPKHTSEVPKHVSQATKHTSQATKHTSQATKHTSQATKHTSSAQHTSSVPHTNPAPKQTSPASKHENPAPKHTSSAPKHTSPVPKHANPAPKHIGPVPKIQVVKYSDYNSWLQTEHASKQGDSGREQLERRDRGKDPTSKSSPKHDDRTHRHARRATVDQPMMPIEAEHPSRHARAESSTHHHDESRRRHAATVLPAQVAEHEARKAGPNKLRKPPPSPGIKKE